MIITGKKGAGIAQRELLMLITVSVAAIVIVLIIVSTGEQAGDAGSTEACRDTVFVQNQKIPTPVYDIPIPVPLACTPEKKITFRGTRNEVKEGIANEMGSCWHKYAEGKIINVFDKDRDIEVDQRGCDVCRPFDIGTLPKDLKLEGEMIITEHLRPANTITMDELKNFLMSEEYNPPILKGGGSRGGIGDFYEYDEPDLDIDSPVEIKATDVGAALEYSFIRDFSGYIDTNTRLEIDKMAAEMYATRRANLFVVVAEEFQSIERKDARAIMARSGINVGDTEEDGVLVLIDLDEQIVRIQMGENLGIYVDEHEIKQLIEGNFEGGSDINKATLNLVRAIYAKITANDIYEKYRDQGINPRSYHAYMENDIRNYPLIRTDILTGRVYVVAFMSGEETNHILVVEENDLNKYCITG